jgi:hypothetical protein
MCCWSSEQGVTASLACESERRIGKVVGRKPQREFQGEETQKSRYASWWGYTYMARLEKVFGSAGLETIYQHKAGQSPD